MLAARSGGIEGCSKGEVEGHQVFVRADDAQEIQTEFRQIEVLDGQLELHTHT